MAKLKKMNGLQVLGLVLAGIIGVGAIAGIVNRNKEEENVKAKNATVNVGELYELAIVSVDGSGADVLTSFLGESSEKSTLKITGGAGTIKAAARGELVFENLTIEDATTDTALSEQDYYLSLGGKIQFKNCVFTNSIYIESEAEAEFINCTFTSLNDWYSVWMGDGSARFKGCVFTGDRALKIHEFTGEEWYTATKGEDVKRVEIDDCEFNNLSKKPGIVIGTFTSPENTTVVVKNSSFTECAAWDNVGSIAGVNGYYETDTVLSDISFYSYGNLVIYDGKSTWD